MLLIKMLTSNQTGTCQYIWKNSIFLVKINLHQRIINVKITFKYRLIVLYWFKSNIELIKKLGVELSWKGM